MSYAKKVDNFSAMDKLLIMAKKAPPINECLTPAGAAKHTGRDKATIYRAIDAGKLTTYETADGKPMVWIRDADQWAKEASPGRPKASSAK